MKPIIDNVNKLIYKIYKAKDPLLAEIIVNWSKIVGAKYSNHSAPLKVIKIREKNQNLNILFIEIDNAPLSMEINFQQDIILERMAVYLGYKAIHKIRTIIK